MGTVGTGQCKNYMGTVGTTWVMLELHGYRRNYMGIVGTTWALSELGSDRTDLSDLGAVTAYQRETVGGGERRRGGGGSVTER